MIDLPDLSRYRRAYSQGNELDSLLAFRDAFKKYEISKQQSLVDLTVTASALAPDIFFNADHTDPLAIEAIRLTNPNFDSEKYSDYSYDELTGILNSAKGKYFELLVVDKLNSGAQVGDVYLPDGYTAKLAESITQPGWDLKLLDAHGNVSDYLQLKATNSVGYIKETLERYPDIAILATDEVAASAPGLVLDSNISEETLRGQISGVLEGAGTSITENFLDAFSPIIPLAFVLATEGYRLSVGKASLDEVLESSRFRVERTVTASGIGALVYAIGGGWLAIPATFIGGAVYDHYRDLSFSGYSFQDSSDRLKKYRLHQQQRLIEGSENGMAF